MPDAGQLQSIDVKGDACWYALYTRSRHELAVERYLRRDGVATYVPLQRAWSRRTDRRKQIDIPALPDYLFIRCRLTPELRAEVKKAPGVVGLVSSAGQPARIPETQIESLRIILESDRQVDRIVHMHPGTRVRIKSGPLKGSCGLLITTNPGSRRLVLQIDHVGLVFSVNLHEADVESYD